MTPAARTQRPPLPPSRASVQKWTARIVIKVDNPRMNDENVNKEDCAVARKTVYYNASLLS